MFVMVTGAVLTTRRVPSAARVLVFQARFEPGAVGTRALKDPM